jgi:hypothetical protein
MSGLIIDNRLNNYLGFAKAGVPVNKNILFLEDKNGIKFYERLASGFFI